MTDKSETLIDINLEEGDETLKLAQGLVAWHENCKKQVGTLLEGAKEGVKLKFGTDVGGPPDFTLTKQSAEGMKIGIILALSYFGDFPLKLQPAGEESAPVEVSVDQLSKEQQADVNALLQNAGLPNLDQ